jgi:hypothetical protein
MTTPYSPDPAGAPSDAAVLTDILAALGRDGYTLPLAVDAEGGIAGPDGPWELADVMVDVQRRLEGASDPADMVAVFGLRRGASDERGALVVSYGPQATAEEADVLRALAERSGVGGAPSAVTSEEASPRPGE